MPLEISLNKDSPVYFVHIDNKMLTVKAKQSGEKICTTKSVFHAIVKEERFSMNLMRSNIIIAKIANRLNI